MKTLSRSIVTCLFAAFLVGCATGPKFSEVAITMDEPIPEQGRIYIYRTAVLGAAVQPEVRLNGETVGKAVPNGFFYVDRDPGHYKVSTSTEVERHLSFTLDKGQTRYVRLNISFGFFVGHVYPELVEDKVGEAEIQECSYTGPL